MNTDDKYKVTIKGPDLSFEQPVSLDVARKLVALAATGQSSPAPDAGEAYARRFPKAPAGVEDPPGMVEFVSEHNAQSNPELVVTIGEYLKKFHNKQTFGHADLTEGFESASQKVPANMSRDVASAKSAGWIAPKVGANGQYYVTGTGREAMVAKFSDAKKPKTAGHTRKKRGKPKK